MRNFQKKLEKLIPSFGGTVDWYVVEELGAIGSYNDEKAAQKNKSKAPGTKALKTKMEELKKKAKLFKAKKKAEQFTAEHFEVMPDVFVQKVKRKKVA